MHKKMHELINEIATTGIPYFTQYHNNLIFKMVAPFPNYLSIIFTTFQKCTHTHPIQGIQDGCILKANEIAKNTMELLYNRIYAH